MADHCNKVKDVNLNRMYEEAGDKTKIKYEIDAFEHNCMFNKAEEESSNQHTFLTSVLSEAEKKGLKREVLDVVAATWLKSWVIW